jgi:hypothetical protein
MQRREQTVSHDIRSAREERSDEHKFVSPGVERWVVPGRIWGIGSVKTRLLLGTP